MKETLSALALLIGGIVLGTVTLVIIGVSLEDVPSGRGGANLVFLLGLLPLGIVWAFGYLAWKTWKGESIHDR